MKVNLIPSKKDKKKTKTMHEPDIPTVPNY